MTHIAIIVHHFIAVSHCTKKVPLQTSFLPPLPA